MSSIFYECSLVIYLLPTIHSWEWTSDKPIHLVALSATLRVENRRPHPSPVAAITCSTLSWRGTRPVARAAREMCDHPNHAVTHSGGGAADGGGRVRRGSPPNLSRTGPIGQRRCPDGRVLPGGRRLRDRRCGADRGRSAGRVSRGSAHRYQRCCGADCRGEAATARSKRLELSPGRARVWPVRPSPSSDGLRRRRSCAGDAVERRAQTDATQDRESARPRDSGDDLVRAAGHLMRLLFIGDIVGRPGRELVRHGLSAIVDEHQVDLVIANAENAAAGFGITREIGDQLLEWGIDVMTSGNHIWDKKEAIEYIGAESRLLRPANYPAGVPGNGSYLARTRDGRSVGVINVMGRVFMQSIDDPFAVVEREIEALRPRARVIFVDFHAEATSEKVAMGWFLDGKVTAMIGTHTHVQTADER